MKETSIEVFEIIFSDDDEDYYHLGHFYSRILEFKYFNTYQHKADLEDLILSRCVIFPEIYNIDEGVQIYTIID